MNVLSKAKDYQTRLVVNLGIIDQALKWLKMTKLTKVQAEQLKKAMEALGRID